MSLARGWSTAVCVASGPSLTDEQCAIAATARRAGRCQIIVVNDNFRKIPDAEILYACDGRWWSLYADAVFGGFRGECWTHESLDDTTPEREHTEVCRRYPWIRRVPVARAEGLGTDRVHLGGNSGYQAIGLAYLFGARRILLIGYDMQRGPNGEQHWHGTHPKPLTNGVPTSWIRRFDAMAADATTRGLTIINCSTTSALTQFPRMSLSDALEETHA